MKFNITGWKSRLGRLNSTPEPESNPANMGPVSNSEEEETEIEFIAPSDEQDSECNSVTGSTLPLDPISTPSRTGMLGAAYEDAMMLDRADTPLPPAPDQLTATNASNDDKVEFIHEWPVQSNSSITPSPLSHEITVPRFEQDYSANRTQEAIDFENAVKRSLNDVGKPASRKPEFVHQRNIDDTILRLSNEFAPINSPGADTLVYIGAPPMAKGEDNADYAYLARHFDQLHRMKSSALKAVNSEKFNKFLGPMSLRTERRLRKDKLLGHSDLSNIKLFVDLRPPNEDEDAVILLTDLTCTKGVLLWYKAEKVFSIERTWVCGKDSFSSWRDQYSVRRANDKHSWNTTAGEDGSGIVTLDTPEWLDALEPEYSPLRHRSAIERLLQAIQGEDPKLNSAPKVWSYFGVAKYFECATHERVNGWITRWIFAGTNINFIQCNPEVTLRLGMGILSPNMTLDAFSILVGEKALLNVVGESDLTVLSPLVCSVHGRKLELLDEDERNRIDHAAASLVRRIRAIFTDLVEGPMLWLEKSAEFEKLLRIVTRNNDEGILARQIIRLVKEYVRGRIYAMTAREHIKDLPRSGYDIQALESFYSGIPSQLDTIYASLSPQARLFTKSFWLGLAREKINIGHSNTYAHETELANRRDAGTSDKWADDLTAMIYGVDSDKKIMIIGRQELSDVAARFYAIQAQQIRKDERSLLDQTQAAISLIDFANGHVPSQPGPLDGDEEYLYMSPKDNGKVWPCLTQASQGNLESVPSANHTVSTPKRAQEQEDTDFPSSLEKRRRISFIPAEESNQTREIVDLPIRNRAGIIDSPQNYHEQRYREPVEPPVLIAPTPISLGSLSFSQDNPKETQGTMLGQKQLRLNAPPTMQEQGHDWHQSPGGTNCDLTERAHSELPNKYYPPPLMHLAPVLPQGMTESSSLQPNSRLGTEMHTDKRFLDATPKQSKHELALQSWPYNRDKYGSNNKKPEKQSSTGLESQYLNMSKMLDQISGLLEWECGKVLYPAHLFHGSDAVPTDLLDTLVCLGEEEWKYLPLWAGGCDDGTGGVFDEADVPNLEKGGFRGGKRGIGNVGGTPAASTADSKSSFDDLASDAVSTLGKASKVAAKDYEETVMSVDGLSDAGDAMKMDGLWEQVREMTAEDAVVGRLPNIDIDDGEVSTVMGAGSDIQGELFGDIDYDDEPEDETMSEESDLEIIDGNDL